MKKYFLLFSLITLFLSGCSLLSTPTTNEIDKSKSDNSLTNTTTDEKQSNNDLTLENQNNKNIEIATKNKLDLSGQGLTKIPNNVFDKTNLQELNVSNNLLSGAIQAEIRHLQNLVVLNASNNQMTGVPAEIGQLKNLEILNLANNQLTGLPYELGDLKNLKVLDISGNNYSALDLKIIIEKLPSNVQIIK